MTRTSTDSCARRLQPARRHRLLSLFLLVMLGCSRHRPSTRPDSSIAATSRAGKARAQASSRPLVPAQAPDSIPAIYSDSSTWVSTGTRQSEWLLRDIVLIRFKPGTPQPVRQEVVDAVGGTVVGGHQWGDGNGLYLVRIPGQGVDAVARAAAVLSTRPEVSFASPDYIFAPALGTSPSGPKPLVRAAASDPHIIKAGTFTEGELARPLCEDGFAIGDTITARLRPARVTLSRPQWWPEQFVVVLRRRAPIVATEGALLRLEVIRATVDGMDGREVEGSFWPEVESGHPRVGSQHISCYAQVNGQLTKTLHIR